MCQRNCFLNSNRIGRRTIIIWGAGVRGKEMAVLLKGYGYKIEGFIDSYLYGKEETVCGLPIYGKEVLKGKQDAFFVLVAIDRYFQEIKAYLYDQNYTETMDFFWLNRTNIEPEIKNGAYQDDFGNVLNIQCETLKLRVLVNGKNNHLDIDGNVCIKENLIIYLSGGGIYQYKKFCCAWFKQYKCGGWKQSQHRGKEYYQSIYDEYPSEFILDHSRYAVGRWRQFRGIRQL